MTTWLFRSSLINARPCLDPVLNVCFLEGDDYVNQTCTRPNCESLMMAISPSQKVQMEPYTAGLGSYKHRIDNQDQPEYLLSWMNDHTTLASYLHAGNVG